MTTLIRTDVDAAGGRIRVDTRSGALRPMVLDAGPTHARIALVAQGALLLAGDQVRIDLDVGAGTILEIIEPSGTVAYDMCGGAASWTVRITLQHGANLVWHGEPFVVSEGADVRRDLSLSLGEEATCLMRETLVLGRSGERPGSLRSRTKVTDHHGPVLVEDLDLSPHSQVGGMLGTNRVVDSVFAFGPAAASANINSDRFVLERNGAVWRRLCTDAHTASLANTWRELRALSRS